ncbi:histidine phosphatase family protein [uncultured Maricaulis sp.]|uniref:SixA phosphatase family protein n=1 Tax=uncultured Maricaulis sp. TaxID=174710 RepID=UPI0030D89D59|tara:strand:+ start:5726 stop:6214 length:489 start_codon:yes stop_codon:yes gene_type:complete
MNRILILMRHAKAVDRMDADDDFQRGLTARGHEDSRRAGEMLAGLGLPVDRALVSPAWRTRQTFDHLGPLIGTPPIEDPMALYHASTEMLERAALAAFQQVQRIVMVGHNPGIGGLAHKLAARCGAREALPMGYPTATATVFSLVGETLDSPTLIGVFNPGD